MTTNKRIEHVIGELCVGGDWACAHGDLEGLGHVVTQLAAHTRGPLRRELVTLADLCRCDPDRASSTWPELKHRVQRTR